MNAIDITKIAGRIKLAALNTGAWRATRLNRKETQHVNDAHGTGDAAKVHVRLTNSETLAAINKLTAAAYDAHKKPTLPAAQDGLRLLPVGREFEHSAKMGEFAAQHRALVAKFLTEYDAEKASAPARLNGLYDARQWPAREDIGGRFLFATRYLSCPTDGTWADWIAESSRAAEDELRERLTDCLQRIAENCAKEKPKIYDTLFSNLRRVARAGARFQPRRIGSDCARCGRSCRVGKARRGHDPRVENGPARCREPCKLNPRRAGGAVTWPAT